MVSNIEYKRQLPTAELWPGPVQNVHICEQEEHGVNCEVVLVMIRARILFDFNYYREMKNLESFTTIWWCPVLHPRGRSRFLQITCSDLLIFLRCCYLLRLDLYEIM